MLQPQSGKESETTERLNNNNIDSRPLNIFKINYSSSFLNVNLLVGQSCPTLCDLWTAAHQTPLSMGFPRQEYWSGLPFPLRGLSEPGIKPGSPALQADSLPSEL